ncbi:MAG: ABC transporter ATP-binding protein [Candidatus Tenebribacter burtonii]|nr:ABC transporter ATP-binding protein [Candidatus Tenebribacter burtonii]
MKKDIMRIIKIMLTHWGYLVSGIFFMLGFALFSGTSVTLAIPLMDNVFKSSSDIILYKDTSSFFVAIQNAIVQFIAAHGSLFQIISKEALEPLLDSLNTVMLHTDSHLLLWIISGTMVLLIVLKNIFYYGQRVLFANLRGRTIKDIRDLIYKKYLYQSLAFFNENKVGDSLVRMVSDVQIIGNFFVNSLFNSLREFLLIIIFAWIALFLNPRLFLISLILLPIFSLIVHFLGNKIKKYSKRIQQQSSNMFSNVEEKLNSMRIVKAFSREQYEMDRFEEINNKHFKFWRKSRIYNAFNVPLSEFNSIITGVIVLIIGGYQVLDPNVNFSFGSFIAFMLAIFSMLHPMKAITSAYANIRKAMVSVGRISEILNKKSEITEGQLQIEMKTFETLIKYKNVGFSYNGSKKVLREINLTINKGEKIALVGSSGSGKTTMVNLLERMYDTTSGEILIDNINIKDIKLQDLRTLMGTVTQESILFADTIANNIGYGTLNKITQEEIAKAAKIAYANEFIDSLSEKYKTLLHTRASNLSGGQRQRLCIARAIVADPPILIFDEATSALDTEAEMKVQKAIEQATKNRTVIVIAHRLSTILTSDKIVVMDDGKIVGMGKHKELIETCDRYKTLHDLQFNDSK